jgi:hypothetical protein
MNINYYSVLDGIIYEDFIFVFLTMNGIYFHVLNDANAYPYKLFYLSDNHLKMSKKLLNKSEYLSKKNFRQMILGIYNNQLFTANCFKEVLIQDIEHILFKLIATIKTNPSDYKNINSLLSIIDKKYINDVLHILNFYYYNDERVYREIFTKEMLLNFKLYTKIKFFEKDFMRMNGIVTN